MSEEFVGIRVELTGDEEVLKALQRLQKIVNQLEKKPIRIRMDSSSVNKATEVFQKLQNTVNKLKKEQIKLRSDVSSINKTLAAFQKLQNTVNRLEKQQIRPRVNSTDINEVNEAARKARKELDRLKLKTVTVKVNYQNIISAGKAIQNLGVGLQSLSNNPLTNTLRTLGTAFTSQLTGVITQGMGGVVSRYDTLRVYPKMMQGLGFSAKEAKDSIHELDMSVRGLPTSLDEITDAAKQYALTTGSIEKGTKYAIAANNAFLASASSESQQYMGRLQLNDLFAGKKLNSREWMSLAASMPAAIREIGKVLGYDDTGKFRRMLYANKISVEDFTDALVKVGTSGGSIEKLADVSKTTLGGAITNTRIAITRLGENVVDALNDATKDAENKGIVTLIRGAAGRGGLIGAIDKLSESMADWIRKHPKEITAWLDTLQSIDWKGIASGMYGVALTLRLFLNLFGSLSGIPGIGQTIGFLTLAAGPLGRMISGIGSLVIAYGRFKQARSKRDKSGGKTRGLFDRFGEQLFGKGGKKQVKGTRGLTKEVERMGGRIGSITASLKGVAVSLAKALVPAGVITAYMGTVWASVKLIGSISQTDIDWKKAAANLIGAASAMAGMTAFMRVFSKLADIKDAAGLAREAVGVVTSLVETGVFYLIIRMLEPIANADLGKGFFDIHKRIAAIGLALAEIKAFLLGLGALTMIPHEAIIEGIGALTSILEAGVFNAISRVLNQVSAIKVPKAGKITAIARAFTLLKEKLLAGSFWSNLGAAIDSGNIVSVANNIRKILNDFSAALGYIAGTDNVTGALSSVRSFVSALKKIPEAINTATNAIKGKGRLWKSQLVDGFKGVDTQIKEKIRNLARGLSGAGSFYAAGQNAGTRYANGFNSMLSSINRIQPRFNTYSSLGAWAVDPRYNSTGGLITDTGVLYRKRGGLTFRPKGTDTVPAMLTPGEYVMNRNAVQNFGADFMRKLNDLDLPGAVKALALRAGRMAGGIAPATYIDRSRHITYNNNQRLSMTNNHASQGYSEIKASRFLRSL